MDRRFAAAAFALLTALGLAGNWLRIELFFTVQFLFGSVFTMLALMALGPRAGAASAALASVVTYVAWNHPYAMVILVAEALVVAWLHYRRRVDYLFADGLFWAVLGVPLVFVFYGGVMGLPDDTVWLTGVKQAVNGVANVLIARGLYALASRWIPGARLSLRASLCEALFGMVLVPSLVFITTQGRNARNDIEQRLRGTLEATARKAESDLDRWLEDNLRVVRTLARDAVAQAPSETQRTLERTLEIHPDLLRIGANDARGVSYAYAPPIDEAGRPNVGKDFSDRPFVKRLRAEVQPMLAEGVESRQGGKPGISALVLAPIVRDGAYDGFVAGVVDIDRMHSRLRRTIESAAMPGFTYVVTDQRSNVLVTDKPSLLPGQRFQRPAGLERPIGGGLAEWRPQAVANQAFYQTWEQALYVSTSKLGRQDEWTLVLEAPLAPYKHMLFRQYATLLTRLCAMLTAALLIAGLLSRAISRSVTRLTRATGRAAERLAQGGRMPAVETRVVEVRQVLDDFAAIARELEARFGEIRGFNERLERDVAARTRELAEESRRVKALAEEFQGLVEATSEGFFALDAQLRVTQVNRSLCRLWRTDAELVVGRPVADFIDPPSLERFREAVALAGECGSARCETRHADPQGRCLDLEMSLTRVASRGTTLAFVRDVSEARALEAARLTSQRLESLGTLAGGIAHDFNNILSAIRGNVDLAIEEAAAGGAVDESLAEIQRATTRAAELVRRIMAFGRGKEPMRESVHLDRVLDEVRKLLRPTLPAGIAMQVVTCDGALPVHADAVQVHEALVNLTTNAAHAIGNSGTIRYTLEPVALDEAAATALGVAPGTYTRLSVADTGHGMDAATRARIFDAFFTTKPQGQGTGLGLSMVHGTMKAHGGVVTVESAPGRGSTFALYFPAVQAVPAPTSRPQPTGTAAAAAGKLRLLHVDDEEALVFLAGRALTRLGFEVTGHTRPEHALAAFRDEPRAFDVVVTDLAMPGMSGFELAAEILQIRPDIPIVLTTGYVREEDEHRARSVGITAIVTKPGTVPELAAVVRDVVAGAHLQPG